MRYGITIAFNKPLKDEILETPMTGELCPLVVDRLALLINYIKYMSELFMGKISHQS